jgi:hypothetical protein
MYTQSKALSTSSTIPSMPRAPLSLSPSGCEWAGGRAADKRTSNPNIGRPHRSPHPRLRQGYWPIGPKSKGQLAAGSWQPLQRFKTDHTCNRNDFPILPPSIHLSTPPIHPQNLIHTTPVLPPVALHCIALYCIDLFSSSWSSRGCSSSSGGGRRTCSLPAVLRAAAVGEQGRIARLSWSWTTPWASCRFRMRRTCCRVAMGTSPP